jgi:hypothetical protein
MKSTGPSVKDSDDRRFLSWLADRLVYVYGESPNVDFVLKLRELSEPGI